MIDRLEVDPFIRQLHVAVIILVVQVSAPIVHGKKLYKPNTLIQLVMLHEMSHQYRNLQKLVQGSVVQQQNEKQYVQAPFFHEANISTRRLIRCEGMALWWN